MTPEQAELQVQRSFNRFCKKTLRNGAISAHTELKRRRSRITNFSDMLFPEETLAGIDNDPDIPKKEFVINGRHITEASLAEAINHLSEDLRQMIQLYYFLNLNDQAISIRCQIPRSTVQYRRSRALNKLRIYLEEHAHGWDDT